MSVKYLIQQKMPITKYHIDHSTWKEKEAQPVQWIVLTDEADRLDEQCTNMEQTIEIIKDTKFDNACITAMNWQSENRYVDFSSRYNQLKINAAGALEELITCKKVAQAICAVQTKEDSKEHSRLLSAQHLIAALAGLSLG